MAETIRLSLDLSPELNATLEDLSQRMHTTKSEVLRKAIALVNVAADAKEHGNRLAITDADRKVVTEIVGL